MARSLTRSNAHFRKAVTRLPLGVSSNFRYWGEDKTIYVAAQRAPTSATSTATSTSTTGWPTGLASWATPTRGWTRQRGRHRDGRRIRPLDRTRVRGRRPDCEDGAGCRARAVLQFRDRGGHGRAPPRAYTGKDSYVVVEGGYHGVFDAALWYTPIEDWKPSCGDPHLVPVQRWRPEHPARPAARRADERRRPPESVFKAYGHEIAAFMIEPIMGNCCSISATREYLRDARALCDRYGILMIIDEVKTGFRVARRRSGADGRQGRSLHLRQGDGQRLPDQRARGREDIMRKLGDGVVHGGTFTCHSVALAAAEKTLEILDETPALRSIAEYGTKMRSGISQILAQRGIRHSFTGHPSMSGLFFSETPPHDYRDWARSDYTFYEALAPELHDLGVLCEPDSREPWFVCEAHDQRCLDETLQRLEEAVDRVVRKQPSPEPARCAS